MSHFQGRIGIVEPIRNRAGFGVVAGHIGGHEKHWHRVEMLWVEVINLHPNGPPGHVDGEPNIGVLQKTVHLLPKLNAHRIIGVASLVVVAIFPENTDTNQVLAFIEGTSHVRPGQKTKSPRIGFKSLIDSKFH